MAPQLMPILLFFFSNQALTQFQCICAAQLFSVRGIWRRKLGCFFPLSLLDLFGQLESLCKSFFKLVC